MALARNSIVIHRPIADVFAVLTDVEKTGTWFPGKVEEHWTSPPPHGVGSRRRAVVTVLGRRTENEAVVTEHEPPRRAAIRGISATAPFEVTLDFRETTDGTRVDVTSQIAFRGAGRVFAPLVTALYGRAWARGLRNLKAGMEAGQL